MSAPPMNVRFNAKQRRAIEELAEEMGVPTGDVLKRAMALLTVAVRERKKGHHIAVVKDDKIVEEIKGID